MEFANCNDYRTLRERLEEYCDKELKLTCWHDYGPASYEEYQADPVKILLVNAESGYEKDRAIPPDRYIKWIKGEPNGPAPTARYCSIFACQIRDFIGLRLKNQQVLQFSRADWTNYYNKNLNLLIEKMRRTIYVNARVTSNADGYPEDRLSICEEIEIFADYRKRFVEILKPRVVICGGKSARDALFTDKGAFPRSSFQINKPVFAVGDYLLVITGHFSRPPCFGGYKKLHDVARECADKYVEKYGA